MRFQFHKGTIKAAAFTLLKFILENFNSIKVQLKQGGLRLKGNVRLFQFHKGTIKASLGVDPSVSRSISIP